MIVFGCFIWQAEWCKVQRIKITTNINNQSAVQHFFFYINNKIRPTSTNNTIINIRSMPNSTTKENQHQQKILFSSTTICLTTNIIHEFQQQNTFNNLGTNDWLWSREVGTQKFLSQGMLGNRDTRKQTWRMK